MDPPTGTSSPDAEPQLRKSTRSSLREAFESLHLTMQLRVIALTAVTSTLLLVLVIGAHWDTRFARSEALDLARSRTASMAERLQAAGGGALDDLQGYPEFMASTFRLQSGEVLQRYVRADLIAERGARAPEALGWTTRPRGAWHWLMGYLALEPIYVESPVELGPNLSGTVSVVVDHRWIWHQGLHGLWQWPVALLIGVLVALYASNLLRRQVVEPLEQLAQTTRLTEWSDPPESTTPEIPGNVLLELATNFDALADRLAEYERAMSTLRHASSQQIVERTRELEMRLRKAEALTRSKDEFLANMSHEIRTPMNGVLGMAELLGGTELDKRQRRFVDSMRAAAETMMQIINDILDDSKIGAGKMDLVPEAFDVRELAEQAGQLYAGQAESKKLEMICRIEPTVPAMVVGDVLRLRQVLGNLLSNAVKYTEQGEVEIRVGLDDLRDGQCRLHFNVRDTGPGIPQADQTGVFEAFTQLGNGSRHGGTGLGLSIANRLVRLMGGEKIELTSELGRGSTFSFLLPFEVREAAQAPDRASDEFSGLRVLVVDDNPTSHLLLEEMLANWSVEVTVLNRARPVGDRMHDVARRGKPFDVVVLDHSLPDATTDELLRIIRLDPVIAGTYVVLLSALDFNASYEGTRAIAPDVCIAKPVRAQLLSAALKASRLPRAAMPESSEPARRQSTTERETLPEFGLRVLVVDDNAINREVAVAMLDELRCTVVVAGDGPSAVANAQQQRFDVIFMDCQMPGMDGYAATEAIRRHENEHGQAATPIVALTANVLARDRDRCLAAGMNAFLSKPFRSAQLVEVLTPIAEARGPAETTAVEPRSPVEVAASAVEPDVTANAVLSDAEVDAVLETPVVSTSTTARLPILDLEQVQSIRGLGKPRVFERLCEMLVTSARDGFERLDSALAAGNLEEIGAAAHALKSPVSNLGGRRLAELLERCETAALETADLVAARRASLGLKAHYAALVAALESETRRSTGTG